MQFEAQIEVATRKGVLNPESKAILQALQSHNFPISSLSMNTKFYLSLESNSKENAIKTLQEACKELLVNPIIQDYTIHIEAITKVRDKKNNKKNSALESVRNSKSMQANKILSSRAQ
ncbi:phosphoribosylformylglycinamidine synthase subunit PurS [Helicobacter sp. MIT 14-3879]|uniref:phosphoribosylformylglycinamidine synthase subunit PurS n=1 Tax=Helicobacter sp. MIT 14-3879 TaxID=2040649 RepID=UPI000E1EC3A5|nr:phosphoribosylformylglycinamidine synthase subunit PurS [Helicobacter sp. MIT 14-3879]RDU60614.1 phosphoribosylformylglycinamidine synthase, purS protein [Helicobacter sp. MIT 14-3879]